ncbi:MAG: c-type cytochrome [Ignavibacteriae bacterium]|nr:c-type cytochrome [Ignavibacteriota bacterium]
MDVVLLLVGLTIFQTDGQQQNPPQQPERNRIVLAIEESIKGKENLPAEEVFKNIQMFKGMPAKRVLAVMEYGFSPALGVKCNYCHEPGKWESDSNKHKDVARKMMAMSQELSAKVREITGENDAAVNCTTCHRGDTKPALNLSPRQRSGG